MSRRCPSVVSLKQILCFLLERCEVFSHWSDSSLFLCWRWNSAASQSGREEKDQTCSTKWRAEDVKLVSDAAISLQIQNGVDRNQWNTITERRLQSEHTDDTWRCRLLIYSRFFLKLFCYLLCLNSCFKVKIFLALVVVGSADGWPVTSEDFVAAAVAEMLHLHISVADSTSGDTKEAQQAGDKRREDNVPNKQFCVQFLSLIKGQNWNYNGEA